MRNDTKNALFKEVELLNLRRKLNLEETNAQIINIDYNTFSNYNHWFIKDNNHYYFKQYYANEFNSEMILNNLICERIAKIFELEAPHFIPARALEDEELKYGLASLNFRKKEVEYLYANEVLDFHALNPSLIFTPGMIRPHDEACLTKLFSLIAFHIYTNLSDTIASNILFQRNNNSLTLAPIYDFDLSFLLSPKKLKPYFYESYFCCFKIPSKEFTKLLDWFPCFREALKHLEDIDMNSIFIDLKENMGLTIADNYYDCYLKHDEKQKELIRSLKL